MVDGIVRFRQIFTSLFYTLLMQLHIRFNPLVSALIGLLGTRFTMEQDFYKGRLAHKHGLYVIVPDEDERETVHQVIYEELCLGIVNPESRKQYVSIMNRLVESGAEGIILGCTEIELLVNAGDVSVSLFPTTRIHAEAAVEKAIEAHDLPVM